MAVALGAVTTAALANGSVTTTFSFVCDGNRLYVRVSGWSGGTAQITGVTFNGVALTKIADSGLSNGGDYSQIWRLASPATTTANIVLTSGSSQGAGVIGANTASGVDSTVPEGTAATNKSTANGTSTGSLAISGAATGDLTIATVSDGGGAAVTPSATGSTATEEWDSASNGEESEGFKAPDAVTAVSATFTSNSWSIAAIPLKAAGAAATSLVMPHNPLAAMLGR